MNNRIDLITYGAAEGQDCTKALQAAVDAATDTDGTVVIPRGTYKIGSVNLKSASLYLERGAVLLASERMEDYRVLPIVHNEFAKVNPLLYSIGGDGVTIMGEGALDLNARAFFSEERAVPDCGKPLSPEQVAECTRICKERCLLPILFLNCKNIRLEGIRVVDSPCWTFTFHNCTHVDVFRLDIQNDLTIPNNDGLHFCGCRDVLVRDCRISAGDDCIAITGIMDWNIPNEHFLISGCLLESSSKAILIGFMHGVVRDVVVTGCSIRNSNRGICIDSSAGTGLVEDVILSGLTIETRVRAGNWWGNGEPLLVLALPHDCAFYKLPVPERQWKENVRNIIVENMICHAENVAALIGTKGNITSMTLRNILFELRPSKNRYLKGEYRLDVAPAAGEYDWSPEKDEWCYQWETGDVDIRDVKVLAADKKAEAGRDFRRP